VLAKEAEFIAAERLRSISVSPIITMMARAKALQRGGLDIIDLSVGEPDFATPENVVEAAERAMRDGHTRYTVLDGMDELKAVICEKFRRDNGLEYELNEVSVAAGAKQSIFNAMMATLNPGDEVILPSPYWSSYADIAGISHGVPVVVHCKEDRNFLLTAEELDAAITPRTRWLVINSPSNPSGAAYSAAEYWEIVEVLKRHPHVWILSDDIYELITFDDFEFTTPAALDPELKARTLTVNGVSKTYAMTGWRIGYAGGPLSLIKAMRAVHSQATSCPCSVSQIAAIEAMQGPQAIVEERRREFEKRRNLVIGALKEMPGLSTTLPRGAFYAYVNCADFMGRTSPEGVVIDSDVAFCEYLLDQAHVALVPGNAFGASPYIRLSYAASAETLTEALGRIEAACEALD